jgi:hypothetical protein
LFWGRDARGGSGEWHTNEGKNWHDGAMAVDWQDFGAQDHCAVFSGKAGEVLLKNVMRVNRIEFLSDEYQLRGESIELTGDKPTIYLGDQVSARISSQIKTSDGNALAPGTYNATTHPQWISGKGTLVIEAPQ